MLNDKGEVFETFDTYHRERVPRESYKKLGCTVVDLDFIELMEGVEIEDSCSTMELPSHNEALKRAKKKIKELEKNQ